MKVVNKLGIFKNLSIASTVFLSSLLDNSRLQAQDLNNNNRAKAQEIVKPLKRIELAPVLQKQDRAWTPKELARDETNKLLQEMEGKSDKEKFELVEERIFGLIELFEKFNNQNKDLTEENLRLQKQIGTEIEKVNHLSEVARKALDDSETKEFKNEILQAQNKFLIKSFTTLTALLLTIIAALGINASSKLGREDESFLISKNQINPVFKKIMNDAANHYLEREDINSNIQDNKVLLKDPVQSLADLEEFLFYIFDSDFTINPYESASTVEKNAKGLLSNFKKLQQQPFLYKRKFEGFFYERLDKLSFTR